MKERGGGIRGEVTGNVNVLCRIEEMHMSHVFVTKIPIHPVDFRKCLCCVSLLYLTLCRVSMRVYKHEYNDIRSARTSQFSSVFFLICRQMLTYSLLDMEPL